VRKYFLIVILLLAFFGFLAAQIVFELASERKNQSSYNQQMVMPPSSGQLFQSTILHPINSATIELQKIKSSSLLLIFWATWCTPCMQELPDLIKLAKQMPLDKLTIIGINGDEKENFLAVRKAIDELGINFPVVMDADGSIYEKFSVSAIPYFIHFKNKKLVVAKQGESDFLAEEFVESL